MTLSIPDPLSWNCPESSAEDWDNVPEMAVQIILYLEKHGKALTEYVKLTAKNESTFELRKDLEEKLKVSCEINPLFILGNEYKPAGLDWKHRNSDHEIGKQRSWHRGATAQIYTRNKSLISILDRNISERKRRGFVCWGEWGQKGRNFRRRRITFKSELSPISKGRGWSENV